MENLKNEGGRSSHAKRGTALTKGGKDSRCCFSKKKDNREE